MHLSALKTGRLVFALTAESRLAHFAAVELFAVVAKRLVALATDGYFYAVVAGCLVALATDDHVFLALKTGKLVACFKVVNVFAFITECRFAHFAPA